MDQKNIKKIVLAYSGGLDTSIIIPWLKEHYNNPEIIAVSGDVGQNDELEGLEEKAIKTGASKLYIADLTDEMVDEVIIPSLKMGASYEQYLLGTAFARPVIGKKLAEIAIAAQTEVRVDGVADGLVGLHRGIAVTGEAGTCRDKLTDDDVLLEALQVIDLLVQGGFGEHAGGLLEGPG